MEKSIAVLFTTVLLLLLGPILVTSLGAIGGFIVGWVFNDTYTAIGHHINWIFEPWQTGAMLAFIGSYLRPVNISNN